MTSREVRRRLRRLGDADNWQTGGDGPREPATGADDRPHPPRSWIVVAAVAVLVVAGSSAVLLQPPRPRSVNPNASGGSAVPWISDSPSPAPTPTGPPAAACRPADFQLTAQLQGTVMGYTQSPVTLLQRSPRTCALTSALVLDTVRNGSRVAAAHLQLDALGKTYSLARDSTGGYLLPPGSRLQLRITGTPAEGQDTVGPYDRSAWLRIDGASVRLPGGRLPANVVDHDLVLSAEAPVDPQDSGHGPYSALRVHIETPDHLTAGTTADYVVRLENVSTTPFAFRAVCPAYEQVINVFPTKAGTYGPTSDERHVLNCRGVVIPGGSSVAFRMRLPVPDGTGPTRIGWFLDDGPSDAAPTVTRR